MYAVLAASALVSVEAATLTKFPAPTFMDDSVLAQAMDTEGLTIANDYAPAIIDFAQYDQYDFTPIPYDEDYLVQVHSMTDCLADIEATAEGQFFKVSSISKYVNQSLTYAGK